MPTYGYKCTTCADTFEILQKITEDALTVCGKCGGKLKKLIYPVGISFKGDGFYVTDYKGAGKDPTPAPEIAKTEAASTETKTETVPTATKPETKPETKTETKVTEAKTETKPVA
jgi:putative FmdB family regulatory protein